MHKAVWKDGREVAVKIQYPGADVALKADLDQLNRVAPLLNMVVPGMQMKPLLAELRDRILEELDYAVEADNQRAFAAAYADDENFAVPRVVASAPKIIVSEWVDGLSLGDIIRSGTKTAARPGRQPADRAAFRRTRQGRPAARRSASGQLTCSRRITAWR